MKKFILNILVLFIFSDLSAQTILWEKLINYFPNVEDEIYSMDQDSDSTFVFSCSDGATNTFIAEANFNGDTIWKKSTNVKTHYNFERIAFYNKAELMHFGNKCMNNYCDSIHFLFQKLDNKGNIISSWDYGDPGVQNYFNNYALLPDGGFLATGWSPSTYYDYLSLMKLDSSGNMLWYKKYRDNSYDGYVIVNNKGNYLLTAIAGDSAYPAIAHTYFLEVNQNGDSINSKYLIVHADSVREASNSWSWGMLQNEDGDYVFTLSIDSVQQRGGPVLDKYAAVVMIDTLFNIKWKLYLNKGTGGLFYPTRPIELKDSSYILVVMNRNPSGNSYYYYKISKTGQILDQKTISSSVCTNVHATEIKLLNDGSMLVSGGCLDYENAYLARIDSVGLPMVSTVTSVAKQSQSLEAQVYPNPFKEEVTFNLPYSSAYKLTLLNALGEEIASYSFWGSEYKLNAAALPKGLYMYVLRDEKGRTKSGKIVAE
jgi:hypothetical protein